MFNVEDRKPSKQYFQTDTIFRVCGRIFEARSAQAATATACTWSAPFKWGVHFDGGEIIGTPVGVFFIKGFLVSVGRWAKKTI